MLTMRYIRRTTLTLLAAGLATFLTAGILVRLGVNVGWCYGLTAFATALSTYRILVPALGDPSEDLRVLRRRLLRRGRRLPKPIH